MITSLDVSVKKRYFSLKEVSGLLGVASHVIRYWEKSMPFVQPVSRGSRRYYQQGDIEQLKKVSILIQEQGYTLKGALDCLEKTNRMDKKDSNLFDITHRIDQVIDLLEESINGA